MELTGGQWLELAFALVGAVLAIRAHWLRYREVRDEYRMRDYQGQWDRVYHERIWEPEGREQ